MSDSPCICSRARSFGARLAWAVTHTWVALGMLWRHRYYGVEYYRSACDDCPDSRPARRSILSVTNGVGGTICLPCSWRSVFDLAHLGEEF